MLEFDDFEEFPSILHKRCKVVDTVTKNTCNDEFGWRIDSGKLDSVKCI